MVTFFIALALLIGCYFIYSRISEKAFAPDERLTPAISSYDGVDKIPLRKGKAFLIELLNIAGTGPIFGAISGALFGPIAFIWIVFGCLLGGGVHDYMSGMISSRNEGASIALLSGKYLGKVMTIIMRIFSILLLVLVTAVFVVSPSSLLSSLTNNNVHPIFFMVLILIYYLLAAILPLDKIIGKAYPFFGVILMVMAVSIMVGLFINLDQYPMLELIGNLRDYSSANGGLPWWPFMLTTIACGAVSGFHCTQTPMIAKCIRNEKEGRQVFYGAMVAEGIIALIWAAVAMAFFKVNTSDGFNALNSIGGGSTAVYEICETLLGKVGIFLAVVGVVICPITSGDTALRSCRLIVGEWVGLNQSKIKNRLILTGPLFLIISAISIWNFLDAANFNILWRWFAWSNQTLATICFVVCTAYLLKKCANKWWALITAIPGAIMFAVVTTYILVSDETGLCYIIPYDVAVIIGASFGLIALFGYLLSIIFSITKAKRLKT